MNTKITTTEITIDINRDYNKKISMKQVDTARVLIIHLLRDGQVIDLTGNIIRLYAEKPDNNSSYVSNGSLSDLAIGKLAFGITSNMLALPGTLKLELTIMESTKVITSKVIYVDVEKTVRNDKAIESSNEFTALVQAEEQLQVYLDELETKSGNLENLYTTQLNNKFNKTGGVISGSTEVTGKLKGNLEHAKDYFIINSFNPAIYGSDNYLQSWYNPTLKAFNISARNVEGGSLQYVDIKNNAENMVSDGHSYTWKDVQTFNEIVSFVKQLRCQHYITFFDHAKTTFSSKIAQIFFNASSNMLTFQPRVSENGTITNDLAVNIKGSLRLNNAEVEAEIGKITAVTSDTTNQEVKEMYLGSGNYKVMILESFSSNAVVSFNVDVIVPSIYKSIETSSIQGTSNKGGKSDALFAAVGIENTVKSGNNYKITIQLTNVYASAQRVYVNIEFIARK